MFDLDAVVIESDDAEPFPFNWGGKAFELPAFISLPADRQIAIIDAVSGDVDAPKLLGILRQAIGADLIAELSATLGGPKGKPLNAMRLMSLITAWINSQSEPGKSPASSGSSASTARPSKAISRSGRARRTS